MLKIFLYICLYVLGGVVGTFAVVATIVLTISSLLVVLLLLQAVGLAPRVPLGYNFRNLVVRWPITLLTVLAVTLVVALMTVMLAFVNGMYELTRGSTIDGNIMVLADGANDEVFSDLGYGDIGTLATKPYVEKMAVRRGAKEEQVPLVSWELYQVINQLIPNAPASGRTRRFIQVRGVEDPVVSGKVHGLEVYEGGRWFEEGAGVQMVRGNEPFVEGVLGEGIAREMGRDRGKATLATGDTFELGPRQWICVGIMKTAGKTFDSEVWAKRTVVGQMLRKDTRSTAVVRVAAGLDPTQVAKEMTADFRSPAIYARTEADYFDSLNATNLTFLYGIIIVTAFMGLGGVLGVMVTMFSAIAQRTREIGVLRILGFARWQILVSFFLEALLLALVGGMLGCALGSVVDGWSATSQLSSGQGGGKSIMLKLIVDYRILACGMFFALVMGCVGGLLPALSAVRLKVLDSLR